MGGEGSGRKPDIVKRLIGMNQPVNSNVSDILYLPNLSGVKHEIKEGTKAITTDDLTEGATNLYDKTVALTEGTGIDITGTYPNFTIASTVSATSPGGSDTQIQYNNGGAFGGSSDLIWDNTNTKLGIGMTPSSNLDILAPAIASTRENILRIRLDDSGNDVFFVGNASVTDGNFVPTFGGLYDASTLQSLAFTAYTTSGNDTGSIPLMVFVSRRTSSTTDPQNGTLSALTTRPAFSFRNNTSDILNLGASGNVLIPNDNALLTFGAGNDATISYDGTNMIINPKGVGTGVLDILGDLSLTAQNIITDTTTGTKIGTGTTQKLGFWNATPIVQPTTAITAATFTANTSGIVDDTATFDGYTIGQVVKALRNSGLLA